MYKTKRKSFFLKQQFALFFFLTICSIFVLSFSFTSKAGPLGSQSYLIEGFSKTVLIGRPGYITHHYLNLNILKSSSSSGRVDEKIILQFIGANGKTVAQQSVDLSSETLDCLEDNSRQSCQEQFVSLPMAMFPISKTITLKLVNRFNAQSSNLFTLNWGKAQSTPDSSQGVADLIWEESDEFTTDPRTSGPYSTGELRSLTSFISNNGVVPANKFRGLAYAFNQKGEEVWQSLIFSNDILGPGNSRAFAWDGIRPWQWEEMCSILLVADPIGEIPEINKINNHKIISAGNCHTETNGIDIAVWSERDGEKLKIHLINLGKLKTNSSIQFKVKQMGDSNQTINVLSLKYDQTIYPYGEEVVIEAALNAQTCKAQVEVDPNNYLRESNKENNYFELSLCK